MTETLARPARPVAHIAARPMTVVMVGLWAGSFVVVRVWGLSVVRHAQGDVALGAIPFFGAWDLELTWRVIFPGVIGAAGVAVLPAVARNWSWRAALVAAALGVVLWSAALTAVDRPANAWGSINTDHGRHVDLVHDAGYGGFLRDYVDRQHDIDRPTHLRAHPPGLMLLLAAADDAGLRNRAFETALAFLGAAAASVAALVVLDDLVGREAARRALPFVVLAPAAVWHANADALYAGVAFAAVALIVRSTAARTQRGATHGVAGGAFFGVALLMTYGVALLALPVAVVAVMRRRLQPVIVAAGVTTMILLLPALWGYSWLAGLSATKDAYDTTVARFRPYSYFVVANVVVFAIAIGPAIVVAITRLRDHSTRLLVGAGLAVVALADITGLSKAETERIWQPFMPLALLAGAALLRQRRWLALQAATAVALAVCLRSPW
jgi:hypothetical protein